MGSIVSASKCTMWQGQCGNENDVENNMLCVRYSYHEVPTKYHLYLLCFVLCTSLILQFLSLISVLGSSSPIHQHKIHYYIDTVMICNLKASFPPSIIKTKGHLATSLFLFSFWDFLFLLVFTSCPLVSPDLDFII